MSFVQFAPSLPSRVNWQIYPYNWQMKVPLQDMENYQVGPMDRHQSTNLQTFKEYYR